MSVGTFEEFVAAWNTGDYEQREDLLLMAEDVADARMPLFIADVLQQEDLDEALVLEALKAVGAVVSASVDPETTVAGTSIAALPELLLKPARAVAFALAKHPDEEVQLLAAMAAADLMLDHPASEALFGPLLQLKVGDTKQELELRLTCVAALKHAPSGKDLLAQFADDTDVGRAVRLFLQS